MREGEKGGGRKGEMREGEKGGGRKGEMREGGEREKMYNYNNVKIN